MKGVCELRCSVQVEANVRPDCGRLGESQLPAHKAYVPTSPFINSDAPLMNPAQCLATCTAVVASAAMGSHGDIFAVSDVERALELKDNAENAHLWQEVSQCCASGNLEGLRSLEEMGADLRHQDTTTGLSALMIAASAGNVDIVKFLLHHGVPWNAVDKEGKTAGNHATKEVRLRRPYALPF